MQNVHAIQQAYILINKYDDINHITCIALAANAL